MWWIYSLLGLVFLWLWDFIKKVMLKNWWDKEVFLFMCFVFYIITLWTNFLLSSNTIINTHTIISAVVIWFFDFLGPIWMLTALKYLDTSTSVVSIRLTSSFFILYIWVNILWDKLSIYNIVWFLLWVIAIILLSWFNFKEKHKVHKKWILAVIIAIIWVVWANSYFKYIVKWVDIDSYMLLKFSFSFMFIILYMILRKKFNNFNVPEIKKVSFYAFLSCIVFITYFLYLLPNIYILWPLSLSYKFLSYSVIVPIILSTIIYKEKINKEKIIAFLLTIISIFLFLI